MALVIKGGRIATATDVFEADLDIDDETINAIARDISPGAGDTVIDATGMLVLPGAIDPHTHLDAPGLGTSTCDDFLTGTVAAAFGGTTTIVDFCTQSIGEGFDNALEEWHGKLERDKPVIDVGFHMMVTDLRKGASIDELASLPDKGVTSYKLFMAYKGVIMVDDETLFLAMSTAAASGALTLVHAENGDVIDVLQRRALAAGHTEPAWHARTRPPEVEAEATNRAIQLARVAGAPLYVVHVSCAAALERVAWARASSADVWGETCTQYLFIDDTMLSDSWEKAARYVFTPPPRTKVDQEALWAALENGTLSVVSTDHAPYRLSDQKSLGRASFTKIPNGAPGIENRLHMLYHFGVNTGKLTLNRLVELTSTNPARLFGLYPRKGTIAVGSDADLVIWNPEKTTTLSTTTDHSRCDYNLYEGVTVRGGPQAVLVRGAIVMDNDQLVVSPGHGRFVARARFREELPCQRAQRAGQL